MSVAKVARKMLYDPGCYDVNITSVQGTLTDQYNPQTKTVNLSQDVYYGTNVAAAAVAATKQAMLCNMLMRMLGQACLQRLCLYKISAQLF
jgi:Zn-dependent membrane protease YugP